MCYVQDYVVSAADCMSFEEGEMEQALQILAKHQGQLSEVGSAWLLLCLVLCTKY